MCVYIYIIIVYKLKYKLLLQERVSSSHMCRRNDATYRTLLACLWPAPPSLLQAFHQWDRLTLIAVRGLLLAWGPTAEPLGSSPASSLLSSAALQLGRTSLSCFLPSLLRCRGSLTYLNPDRLPFPGFPASVNLTYSRSPFSLSLRTPRTFPTTRSRGSQPWLFPGLVPCFLQICFSSSADWSSFQPVGCRASSILGLSHIPEVCLKYQRWNLKFQWTGGHFPLYCFIIFIHMIDSQTS